MCEPVNQSVANSLRVVCVPPSPHPSSIPHGIDVSRRGETERRKFLLLTHDPMNEETEKKLYLALKVSSYLLKTATLGSLSGHGFMFQVCIRLLVFEDADQIKSRDAIVKTQAE